MNFSYTRGKIPLWFNKLVMVGLFKLLSVCLILSLIACSSTAPFSESPNFHPEADNKKLTATASPNHNSQLKTEKEPGQDKKTDRIPLTAERFDASVSGINQTAPLRNSVQLVNGAISLNFLNTDLKDFLSAVLGEILHLNYVVDPSAQGTVTLETTQAVKKEAVLPIVESTLQLNGLAIVETGGFYRIVPNAGAAQKVSILADGGFRAKIVPLRYVSVSDMQQAIEAIVPSGSILRADPIHNLFIVAGNSHDIDSVTEAISTFDVDSLSGLSFGLYPIKNTTARALHLELLNVLSGTTVANMVKLVPLERLNAILVSSKQRRYIDEVEKWIGRLDRTGNGNQQSLYVYRVQNGRAVDLVAVLNKALLGENAGTGNSKSSSSSGSAPNSAQYGNQNAALQSGNTPPVLDNDSFTDREVGDAELGKLVLSSGILRITADEINNAILIYATPEGYRTVESALRKLDITPLQVLIEVAITEVTLNDELNYGVQYFFTKGQHSFTQIENKTGILTSAFPGFNYVWTGSQKIQTLLSLLESITKVKMLASPQLLVLNNQQAHIMVGDQVPVATQSAVSTVTSTAPIVNSIEYKNTGINLNVTPRVNDGGLVLLDISQEVSGVTKTTSSSLDSPTIQQRMITSSVAVNHEETIALGGLIKEQQENTKNGVPLLQDIPYLGSLFGVDSITKTRTELLVLITPHVIKNSEDGKNITEELRKKVSSLSLDQSKR